MDTVTLVLYPLLHITSSAPHFLILFPMPKPLLTHYRPSYDVKTQTAIQKQLKMPPSVSGLVVYSGTGTVKIIPSRLVGGSPQRFPAFSQFQLPITRSPRLSTTADLEGFLAVGFGMLL